MPRRATAVIAAISLVPGLALAQGVSGAGAATPTTATAATLRLAPEDGVYRAKITRTEHGIPHIVARDYGSLGYGEGYATAETSICNLVDTVMTARGSARASSPGKRSLDHVTLDATNLQSDTLFSDIRNRRVVEKLLADPVRGPGAQTRALVKGYAAGVNRYLRDIGGSRNITDPACRGKRWVARRDRQGHLVRRLRGQPARLDRGLRAPDRDAAPPSDLEGQAGAGYAPVPETLPTRKQLLKELGKDPDSPFGSNATAVGADATTTGRGMVLGNPHFPWRGRYRFTQFHLTIPGEYDVAGAGLIGSPVVNIGWNRNVAWSHTVSTAYRFTPYEYKTIPAPRATRPSPVRCGSRSAAPSRSW